MAAFSGGRGSCRAFFAPRWVREVSQSVREYWLIDPRGPELRFDILRHGASGYRKVPGLDGWRKSVVFGAAFRFMQTADPLGEPAYVLEVR
jgi:hypothetical protein